MHKAYDPATPPLSTQPTHLTTGQEDMCKGMCCSTGYNNFFKNWKQILFTARKVELYRKTSKEKKKTKTETTG